MSRYPTIDLLTRAADVMAARVLDSEDAALVSELRNEACLLRAAQEKAEASYNEASRLYWKISCLWDRAIDTTLSENEKLFGPDTTDAQRAKVAALKADVDRLRGVVSRARRRLNRRSRLVSW